MGHLAESEDPPPPPILLAAVYRDGGSEIRMGKALQGGYRQRVFLTTKIDGRTRKAAAAQVDESLRRLRADVTDLIQHHEIIRLENPDRIFAEDGAQEALLAAQKAGKVRFIGFTGHKDPVAHLRMLEVAAKKSIRFEAQSRAAKRFALACQPFALLAISH